MNVFLTQKAKQKDVIIVENFYTGDVKMNNWNDFFEEIIKEKKENKDELRELRGHKRYDPENTTINVTINLIM